MSTTTQRKEHHHLFCKPRCPTTLKPKVKWSFDIETANQNKQFVCCVVTNNVYRRYTLSKEQTQSFFHTRLPQHELVVATNLQFDFFGVYSEEQSKNYHTIERNGVLYNVKLTTHNQKKLMFYDTLRFNPTSVEKLAKICHMEKMPHPKCFTRVPENESEWDELIAYCENDALISQVYFDKFVWAYWKKYGLRPCITIASTSMQEWKTHHLKETLYVESPEIHQLCFQAYKGGRVEVFQRGTFDNVQYYDFNSLYPSVMLEHLPHPNHSQFHHQITPYHIEHFEGVVEVEGYQEYRNIPLLSVKHGGKLITPTGYIKGTFTFVELREALKDGFNIYKTGKGVVYFQTAPFFKSFITEKYAQRKQQKAEGDPMENTTKNVMNNLYGKTGQKYETQSELVTASQLTYKKLQQVTRIEEYRNGFYRIETHSDKPPAHSFPIMATYITALARIKLWKSLRLYQDRVLYCDTDSLFLTNGTHIPDSTELGVLKHEGDFEYFIPIRPKVYITSEYVKMKGVKTKLNPQEALAVVKGKGIDEEFFIKPRSALRSMPHHKFGIVHTNQIIEKTKHIDPNDTKRDWGAETFDETRHDYSHPLHLAISDYE